MPFRYLAYGLGMSSVVELPVYGPSLMALDDVDVEIVFGAVPESLDDPRVEGLCFQARPQCLLLSFGSSRILVEEGKRITVAMEAEGDMGLVRCLVTTTAMAAVLLHRGLLPLHAGAVERDGKGVLLIGACASGKSSLVAALAGRGFRVVENELLCVEADDDGVWLRPGQGRVALWTDVLGPLGLETKPSIMIRERLHKRLVDVGSATALRRIPAFHAFFLCRGKEQESSFRPMKGAAKFQTTSDRVYLGALARAEEHRNGTFGRVTALCEACEMTKLGVPRMPLAPQLVAERIEEYLEERWET